MILYGSYPSPYVRRLRMCLFNNDHEFVAMQIYEGEDRERLLSLNPTAKIPMLEDGEQVLFDSRVIFRYLAAKYNYPPLSWEQENHLTLIDSANDSFVSMFLLSKSDIDVSEEKLFFKLQRERVNGTLKALNELAEQGAFDDWHYPSICLYSLIDWVEFRQLHNLKGLDAIKAFHERNSDRIEVTATDPRAAA